MPPPSEHQPATRRTLRVCALVDGDRTFAPPGGIDVTISPHQGVPAVTVAARAAGSGAPAQGTAVLPHAVLVSGLVNAHAHLDLTHIGPRPFDLDAGFVGWAASIMKDRRSDTAGIGASVDAGVQASLRGGVVAVGDIAGDQSLQAARALARSPLGGVSFIELFGHGERAGRSVASARELLGKVASVERESFAGLRVSLQPHAPYSAGLALYKGLGGLMAERARTSATTAPPLATHLAETPAELDFVARAAGPFVKLLETLGVPLDAALQHVGDGASPVELLAPVITQHPVVLAHVNAATDRDIELLATLARGWAARSDRQETRVSTGGVVYCARASRYFGHHETFGPHRFPEMLEAGVPVALGTDSVVNLPEHEAHRITPLDDARLLFREQRADARTLLRMITSSPARMLGLDAGRFAWPRKLPCETTLAGVVLIDLDADNSAAASERDHASAVLASDAPPRLLWDGATWAGGLPASSGGAQA